jgi:hypothetical protein
MGCLKLPTKVPPTILRTKGRTINSTRNSRKGSMGNKYNIKKYSTTDEQVVDEDVFMFQNF